MEAGKISIQERLTPEIYLAWESSQPERYDYYNGEIIPMSGGGEPHNIIISTLNAALFQSALKNGCRLYSQGMKVNIETRLESLFTYPDVVVSDGKPLLKADNPQILTNPRLIIEVLSKSTERYDRGVKFKLYQTISTLNEIIFIEQSHPKVERWVRHTEGRWLVQILFELEAKLEILGFQLPLSEIYQLVDFGQAD